MSTILLIPLVGALCVAAATLLLPSPLRRGPVSPPPPPDEAGERLVTRDEIRAVCAAFDRMLVDKGLVTTEQLDTIRCGVRTRAVVTALRRTGRVCEDYCEVDLDLIVTDPCGGQFPAHETALIPAHSLDQVTPGSDVVVYYRDPDRSAVAVWVPHP